MNHCANLGKGITYINAFKKIWLISPDRQMMSQVYAMNSKSTFSQKRDKVYSLMTQDN